jgi:CubicO group peptidase (beta-lactamase class C family)
MSRFSDSLTAAIGVSVLIASAGASAQLVRYDFSNVTGLAEGAVAGQNVGSPVPGFELLLMKDGQTVYRRSFGTWFNGRVAAADSATKTVSGAVIMSLVDSSPNPFSLDTRLSEYIPEFDGPRQGITIRQCFAHTAGLRSSSAIGNPNVTLYEAALDIADDPLLFVPGTTFSYGGTSMHAAGAVAQIAGGAPWNTLFQQRIAGPLGMTSTRYVLTSPDNPRIAGGCESTAPEFARLMEMLRRGGVHNGARLLSAAAVQQMFTRQTPSGVPIANTPLQSPYTDGADYGVGVWLDERDAQGNLLGALAAGARGFSSWIDFDDGMVGVFASDLTAASNIQGLLYLIRSAAQEAIRNPQPCTADFNADGDLNSQDFFDFLIGFFAGEGDFDHDGATDSQDFFDFVVAFFQGCA